MIAPAQRLAAKPCVPEWHEKFMALLPTICRRAQIVFRDLSPEAREDAVAEVLANCVVAYARLVELGKESVAYPTVLAMYAIRQYRSGRRVGNRINSRDAYSQYAQEKGGFEVKHLGAPYEQHGGWKEQLVDNMVTPVADQAAFRIDFPEWLRTLSDRNRRVAEELAVGERTGDVARRSNLSDGRVSQLRRELEELWHKFTAERTVDRSAATTVT